MRLSPGEWLISDVTVTYPERSESGVKRSMTAPIVARYRSAKAEGKLLSADQLRELSRVRWLRAAGAIGGSMPGPCSIRSTPASSPTAAPRA